MRIRRGNPGWMLSTLWLVALTWSAAQTLPVRGTQQGQPGQGSKQQTRPVAPAKPQIEQQSHTEGRATSEATVRNGAAPVEESVSRPSAGVLVDQVIGVVNGDLILESDVDEERRFSAFQPFRDPAGTFSREKAIERLVDRALILQQAKLQPDDAVTLDEAKAELQGLRKDIPACKQYHCETEAGWQKFVAAQGFTFDELNERWRERMQILKFIEVRFRSGIRITKPEMKEYYDKSLMPAYERQGVKAPSLDSISDRIQEVLLQQRVGSLLSDWLLSLKAQGNVRMMQPDEVAP